MCFLKSDPEPSPEPSAFPTATRTGPAALRNTRRRPHREEKDLQKTLHKVLKEVSKRLEKGSSPRQEVSVAGMGLQLSPGPPSRPHPQQHRHRVACLPAAGWCVSSGVRVDPWTAGLTHLTLYTITKRPVLFKLQPWPAAARAGCKMNSTVPTSLFC